MGSQRLDAPATDRLAAMAAGIAERSGHDLSQLFHDLRFEVSEEARNRLGTAFRDAMMLPMLTVLEALELEGRIAPASRTGLSRAEGAMFVLSVIRMLTEAGTGPARGADRAPEMVGDLTVRLVLNGLAVTDHRAHEGELPS